MATTYEVRSGKRPIGLRDASTAQQALVDYVRGLGCSDDEIMRLGPDAVSWRGAVYRAVPVEGALDATTAAADRGSSSERRRSRVRLAARGRDSDNPDSSTSEGER